MTDLTTPGEIGAAADNRTAGWAWAETNIHPWIHPSSFLSGDYSSIDTTGVNAFQYSATDSTGLTAVFDGGEGFIYGWLVRDTQSSVDLPANASRETVYVGYNPGASLASGEAPADSANVIVGTSSAFASTDPRIEIYDFDTDGSSITNVYDRRRTRRAVEYDNFEGVVKVVTDDGSTRAFDVDMESGLTRALEDFEVGGGRIYYDSDKTGKTVHVQRDKTSAETALTFEGTDVGVGGQTAPTYPLDVNGMVKSSDGFVPPDVAGGSLPSGTEAGRIVYDSSREQ